MPQGKSDLSDHKQLAERLLPSVHEAGKLIMEIFRKGCDVIAKGDGSPVTEADRRAEEVIVAALSEHAPNVPVVAEEAAAGGAIAAPGHEFFLVDPLDGTREFINGRDEFTINIGLIRDTRPCFGLIYAPALSQIYITLSSDHAAVGRLVPDDPACSLDEVGLRQMHVNTVDDNVPLTVCASRSHGSEALEHWLAKLDVAGRVNIGSSLKFCQVADGTADIYPRFGPTKEWDTAAGHAIVEAAGGLVTKSNGQPLAYGKVDDDFLNPEFIAAARRFEAVYT